MVLHFVYVVGKTNQSYTDTTSICVVGQRLGLLFVKVTVTVATKRHITIHNYRQLGVNLEKVTLFHYNKWIQETENDIQRNRWLSFGGYEPMPPNHDW